VGEELKKIARDRIQTVRSSVTKKQEVKGVRK
jgi:hypothetical protein